VIPADPLSVNQNFSSPLSEPTLPRRTVLVRLGATLAAWPVLGIAACASSNRGAGNLPEVAWPATARPVRTPPAPARASTPKYAVPDPTSTSVISRSEWAKSAPVPSLMDPMMPVNKITLHHDGMPSGFNSTSRDAAAAHMERIRLAHRDRNFGDIGYHFVIDPAGRIWAGRPLNWQGAHVKDQNPGNLGICFMGNYEIQQPNHAQLVAAERFVGQAMRHYNIRVRSVYTHRELAPTACPGRYLQPQLVGLRQSRSLA
jgi:hypothetical protein